MKRSCLVVNVDGVDLGDTIVTAGHSVMLRDRLVLMDQEFGDPSKGQRRTLDGNEFKESKQNIMRPHTLRKSDMFVDWSSAAEEMSTSRSLSVIAFADKADLLGKGVRVAIQYNPSSGGGDIRDGMRLGEL